MRPTATATPVARPQHFAHRAVLAWVALIGGAAAAQGTHDLRPAANALLAAAAPDRDDPAATIELLLTAAERERGHAVGARLLGQLYPALTLAVEPDALVARLLAFHAAGSHGAVIQEADALRRRLLQRLGRFDRQAAASCITGYGEHFTVVGPFGDQGDFYSEVAFAPERTFPAAGTSLPGRFGHVQPRAVQRDWHRFRVELREPRHGQAGCFYALHQITAPRATPCYVRIWCGGSFTVFVNGRRLWVVDRGQADEGTIHFVPAVLQAGHNHVLIKTTDNEETQMGLRYVDADGHPLRGLVEFIDTPTVRPHASIDRGIAPPPPWRSDATRFADAAAAADDGEDRAVLQLAAVLCAPGPVDAFRRLDPLWQTPPQNLRSRLVLADLLRHQPILPATIRHSQARKLVEDLIVALPDHHTAQMQRVDLLEDEDRREEAIRLLRVRVDGERAGPATYSRLAGLYRQLSFAAELRTLRQRWMVAQPTDLRPLRALIGDHEAAGDIVGAERLARRALTHHAGDPQLLATLFGMLADRGDGPGAGGVIPLLHRDGTDALARLQTEASLARRLGDPERQRHLELQRRIAADPRTSMAQLQQAARACVEAGAVDDAIRIDRAILAARPGAHAIRRRLARSTGAPEFPNLLRFRTDAAALAERFVPTPREGGAPSTLLLDSMIVEVMADGSYVEEVHTLRRINDQSGVEQFEHAQGAADADEVILVRTIGTDGRSYLPNRVQGRFSMPRLQPGALVEEHYRNFHDTPSPGPWRATRFYFQSRDCPFLRSQLVMILPARHPGTLQRRRFNGAYEEHLLADGKTAHLFRVVDSPRLPTELSPPPLEDIAPMVTYGEDRGVEALTRRLLDDARRRSLVTPIVARQAQTLVQGATTDLARAAAIHAFVHQEIAEARGAANPTTVLMQRQGPRFFLEVALLQAAGVPLRHGLCAGSRRELRAAGAPFFSDEVPYEVPCVRVAPREGPVLWLFADAPRHYPLPAIPADRQGAEVLLASPAEVTSVPDAGDWAAQTGLAAAGTLRLDAQGAATLQLKVTLRGVRGFAYAEGIRNEQAGDRARIARGMLGQIMPGWTIREATFAGLAERGPLEVHGTLYREVALRPAGDRFLLPLPMPPSELLRTFGGRGKRTLPLRLIHQNAMEWRIRVEPGTGFAVATTPQSLAADELLLDFALTYAPSDDAILISRHTRQRAGEIPAAAFGAWRALLERLDQGEAGNLLLTRRPAPTQKK